MSGQQSSSKVDAIGSVRRTRYTIGETPVPVDPVELPQIDDQLQQVVSEAPAAPVFYLENPAIAPLTSFLGPLLTVANPAWMGDPVPRMRMLQKILIATALELHQDDRADCLHGVTAVENAVQLRLRWEQMRMTEEELNAKPENVSRP